MHTQRISKALLSGFLTTLLLCSSPALQAQPSEGGDVQFNIKPKRCIALHQGQTCYQKINISWKSNTERELCLRLNQNGPALHCWEKNKKGKYKYDLQSKADQIFYLFDKNNIAVASTKIKVAWVYAKKQQKRSSWRLF